MIVRINLKANKTAGNRVKSYDITISLDRFTNKVFISLADDKGRDLAGTLEDRGGIGGALLANWFGRGDDLPPQLGAGNLKKVPPPARQG